MKKIIILIIILFFTDQASAQEASWPAKTHYRYKEISGHKMFYREAGDVNNPTIVLLHGYPSSSHTYRELIPLLSGKFHVIAPDNLGSGYSDRPSADTTDYTFDLLSDKIFALLEAIGVSRYTMYMQDFGAPVGYRVMMRNPDRIKAIIVQNANAYFEGLTAMRRNFFYNAHTDKSTQGMKTLQDFTSRDSIINKQYLRDVKGKEDIMNPDSWTHDLAFLQTDADRKIQIELFQDYYNNLLSYEKWQNFLRTNQYPMLIVWGKNDPAFIAAGAEAYLKDVPEAELHLLDAGHFAAEEMPVEIAKYITVFMERNGK